MRSLKHFTNAPLPPLRYLYSCVLHLAQKMSTVFNGPFLLGFAITQSQVFVIIILMTISNNCMRHVSFGVYHDGKYYYITDKRLFAKTDAAIKNSAYHVDAQTGAVSHPPNTP